MALPRVAAKYRRRQGYRWLVASGHGQGKLDVQRAKQLLSQRLYKQSLHRHCAVS